MTPIKRARDHINGIRFRADEFPEPLRSELVAISVALKNMMSCIERPAEAHKPEPPMEYRDAGKGYKPSSDLPRSYDEALSPRWTETV